MNNDLISREALKEEICNDKELSHWLNDSLMLKVFKYIDNAPTIELRTGRMVNGVIIPIERPQGEWIYDPEFTEFGNPYGTYKCDKCGGHSTNKYPFCFWCGAKMKGGAET